MEDHAQADDGQLREPDWAELLAGTALTDHRSPSVERLAREHLREELARALVIGPVPRTLYLAGPQAR